MRLAVEAIFENIAENHVKNFFYQNTNKSS